MKCRRCAGLMYRFPIGDHLNESGELWVGVWECYNCGEIVDSLILQNREHGPRPQAGRARLKTFSPSRLRVRTNDERAK